MARPERSAPVKLSRRKPLSDIFTPEWTGYTAKFHFYIRKDMNSRAIAS